MSRTSALTQKPKGLGRRNFAQGYPSDNWEKVRVCKKLFLASLSLGKDQFMQWCKCNRQDDDMMPLLAAAKMYIKSKVNIS